MHDIDQIPFSVCNIFDDVDDSYWAFNKLLREIVDEHVPIKRRRTSKQEAPFLNTEYRKMLRKKATCWHAYLKAKNNANWERYRCARNRCTSLKRSAIKGALYIIQILCRRYTFWSYPAGLTIADTPGKQKLTYRRVYSHHFQTTIAESIHTTSNSIQCPFKEYVDDRCQGDTNGKMFWQTIRPFLSNKGCPSQNTIVLRELNDIKTNPSEVCEICNANVINVASDIGWSQNCNDYANHPSIEAIKNGNKHIESFAFKPVGCEEVYRKLCNLKCNKATDCDQMPAKVLKIVSQNLATPLARIINDSINQSRFPQDLKLAGVSPVYKKKR